MTVAVRSRRCPRCVRIEKRTGAPDCVLEHAVAVAIGEAEAGEQRPRARRIVRDTSAPTPEYHDAVARRHRPEHGHGGAEIHGVDDRVAIDGARDRLAEFRALQVGSAFGGRRRRQVEPEHVRIDADADVGQRDRALLARDAAARRSLPAARRPGSSGRGCRPRAAGPRRPGSTTNLHDDAIEVRQRRRRRRPSPVVRDCARA